MAGPANPDSVQPVAGGPLDPAWSYPKSKPEQTDREKQVGRALTTVNSNDFATKPSPAAPETD